MALVMVLPLPPAEVMVEVMVQEDLEGQEVSLPVHLQDLLLALIPCQFLCPLYSCYPESTDDVFY